MPVRMSIAVVVPLHAFPLKHDSLATFLCSAYIRVHKNIKHERRKTRTWREERRLFLIHEDLNLVSRFLQHH